MSLRFDRLLWPPTKTYADFKQSMERAMHCKQNPRSAARNEAHFILVLDQSFVDHLGKLNDDEVLDLFVHLPRTRITGIKMNEIMAAHTNASSSGRRRRNALSPFDRLRRLFDTLGFIPTLSQASVLIGDDYAIRALEQLPHLTSVSISTGPTADEGATQILMTAITRLSTILTIELTGETRLYHVILPELLKLPLLSKISMTAMSHGRLQATFPFHMDSLTHFLADAGRNHPLSVKLQYFNFAASDTHSLLCQVLETTSICSLELHACSLWNGDQLAQALAKSTIRRLVFSHLVVNTDADASGFISNLGSRLPQMTELETLEANLRFRNKRSKRVLVEEEAITALFSGAAHCQSLKVFKVTECACPLKTLDSALAESAASKFALKHIDVALAAQSTKTNSIQHESFTFPVLCEAIKKHYTRRTVRITQSVSQLEQNHIGIDTTMVDTMLRLNQCGRNYMMAEPGNKLRGVSVLSQVGNSLNCLYIHLRENPALCQSPLWHRGPIKRKVTSINQRSIKRKATPLTLPATRVFNRSTRGLRQSTQFGDE